MKPIFHVVVFSGLFTGIGLGQTQLDAFEHLATEPGARVVLSKEVDCIDTDRAHAVITALIVEEASSNPQRMRGVRIDLSDGGVTDQVYTGADFVERMIDALNEIGNSQRLLSGGSRSSNTCFGSCQFRQQPGHAFSASSCFLGDWHGLVVSTGINTAIKRSFRFTNFEASSFAVAIGHTRDELK